MPTQEWTLDNVETVINSGEFTDLSANDFVEMDKVLRNPDLVADDVVTARGYLFEAAEKRIDELAEKDFADANSEDLDSFVALLEHFSSRDADGYKGKAAEIMKKIEQQREQLKKQQEEAETKFFNQLEDLTPAELWELRKNLKEQNSPQAQEENKKVEDFIVNKVTTLVNGGVFNPNDEQAPALKELLADIENNPVSVETAEKKKHLLRLSVLLMSRLPILRKGTICNKTSSMMSLLSTICRFWKECLPMMFCLSVVMTESL